MNLEDPAHPLNALLQPEYPDQVQQKYDAACAALGARLGIPAADVECEVGRRLLAQELDEDEEVMRWLSLRSAVEDWRDAGVLSRPAPPPAT